MRSDSANKKNRMPCKKKNMEIVSRNQTGLLGGVLLALLPKCPFWYVAFSGTLVLCGNGGGGILTRTFSSLPTQIFSVAFCQLILLLIVLNFRDKRTLYAIALAVVGSAMVIYSTTIADGLMLYYPGVVMIFFGVWLNASLLYFINRIRKHFTDLRKEAVGLEKIF